MTDSDNSAYIPSTGDWVRAASLARTGQVVKTDLSRAVADVQFGSLTSEVAFADLIQVESDPAQEARMRRGGLTGSPLPVEHRLDLHGLRVEEAMEALDKFLDSAVVNGLDRVKVVHGHGEGKLRTAVREHLDVHPHVRQSQFGAAWEGGLAVTMVHLDVPEE